MLGKEQKNNLITEYKIHSEDSGSMQVQIALLTQRINQLNEHFKMNRHDYASKMGLMKLVGQRRRFLRYLKKKNESAYQELINRLGLRG